MGEFASIVPSDRFAFWGPMPKPYSLDLRERAIEAVVAGASRREVAEQYGLSPSVVFIDESPDLEPIYGLTDALLLSARLDPMPNEAIDAAYRGISIICLEYASGTAEILISDPAAAFGVVDCLDPLAASQAIAVLATDPARWVRVAEAIRNLVRSALDMTRYVGQIDALGTAAPIRVKRHRDAADLSCRSKEFDQGLYLGPEPLYESRSQTLRRAVARHIMNEYCDSGRTAPGFNPFVWRLERPEQGCGDPLAEFVRNGRPSGPWFTQALVPEEAPSSLEESGIRPLLHVHLSDTNRAFKLLKWLRINRRPFDWLVSTAHVRLTHVAAVKINEQSSLRWLLSQLELAPWNSYCVVGHLPDCSDDTFVDFQWTALIGSRQAMLDRIVGAFSTHSRLGVVLPCDPILPSQIIVYDYPSREMFWTRRQVLTGFRDSDSAWLRNLPRAGLASGLTQAVTHVPGIFL